MGSHENFCLLCVEEGIIGGARHPLCQSPGLEGAPVEGGRLGDAVLCHSCDWVVIIADQSVPVLHIMG